MLSHIYVLNQYSPPLLPLPPPIHCHLRQENWEVLSAVAEFSDGEFYPTGTHVSTTTTVHILDAVLSSY